MQFGIRRRKWPGKDLGSWLIILGYVTIVVGIVTVTRDWTLKSVVSDSKASVSVSSKGFVPYLDSLDPQPILAKGSGRSLTQGRYMAPRAMLEPLAPWEIGQLSENDPSEGEGIESSTMVEESGSLATDGEVGLNTGSITISPTRMTQTTQTRIATAADPMIEYRRIYSKFVQFLYFDNGVKSNRRSQ